MGGLFHVARLARGRERLGARPQPAEDGIFASPRIRSANGARGPTATAIQNHAFDDLLRSRAIAPASGIDAIAMMTKSQVPMQVPTARLRHDTKR